MTIAASVSPITFPNAYCPITPSARQREFLEHREVREVFFGGAAGGGKSVALLMGALEYIDVPGYAALILRKDLARMELAGGVIPRLHEWLAKPGMATRPRWIASRRQWIFPIEDRVPATIMFGYLSRPLDKFRYASSEFQYIAFDELTDFTEEDYLFLFSRLRRNTSVQAPLRMRSASNPGGPGHAWVKERFVQWASQVVEQETGNRRQETGNRRQETGDGRQDGSGSSELILPTPSVSCSLSPVSCGSSLFHKHDRLYIPSRISDNPGLDEAEYRKSLMHLPAVERERLMNGDWEVQERGLIHVEWLRYFVENAGQLELSGGDGRLLATIPDGSCRRFVTIDPAGTSAERTQEARGRTPSWTVAQVWEQPPRELSKFLVLRHQVRRRVGFDGLCDIIQRVFDEWRPERIWIEGEKLGRAACDMLRDVTPIDCLATGRDDKVARAGPLIIKLERGEVFLPKFAPWLGDFEAELLAWRGERWQATDQIDAAAYAALVVRNQSPQTIRLGLGLVKS